MDRTLKCGYKRYAYEHMDDSSPPACPSSSGAATSTSDSESGTTRPSNTTADKIFFLYVVCSEFYRSGGKNGQHCEQTGQFI